MKNWAGNQIYHAAEFLTPTSVEQVAELVKRRDRVHVLGSRHSFSSIADTEGAHLSLAGLNRVLRIDRGPNPAVTVEGGITYAQLCPVLAKEGLALANLASLPHISVAGAIATATHGSGVKIGNLATSVLAMRIVKADGELVTLEGDAIEGAAVNLGALGVVVELTLKLEPGFTVRQRVYERLPLERLRASFDEILSAAYSVSLFTEWGGDTIDQVWVKRRGTEPEISPALVSGATPAVEAHHPIRGCDAAHCNEQFDIPGEWYERLPHFRIGLTPSAGAELQTEYFVSREHAMAAFDAIDVLRVEIHPLIQVTEIRTIAADNLWMSMNYERSSVAFHFTWKPEWERVRMVLPKIEAALRPFAPRPHWGKLFTLPGEVVRASYPRARDFADLARRFDPTGKFANEFLRSTVLSA